MAAAFAPDGRSALAAGQDRVIRLIDPATGRVIGELLRHPVAVKRLRYEPDRKEFTTFGDDGIERRWDAETGAPRGIPVPYDPSVTRIASSPDGRFLLKVIQHSRPERRSGQLWDREGHPLGLPFPMYSIPEGTRDMDQDGEAILAGTIRGPLLARLAIGPAFAGGMRGGDSPVHFSRDGKTALTVGIDGNLRLWDVASLQPRGPAFQASRSILALSRDGDVAATRGPGDAVRLWSTTRGKLVAAFSTRGEWVSQLSFSPDGTRAISWSVSATQFGGPARYEVSRWDVASGQPIGPPLSHGSWIRSAGFSPDGSTILTLGDQDNARLWNTATGRLIGSWPLKPTGSVRVAAFHPDGKTLVTGGTDGTLWRWSTSTGLAAGPPLMVGSAIRIIAYAAKGRTLMTISTDSTSLWDAETGRRLAPPLPARDQLLFNHNAAYGAAVSPDGMRVLTKEPYTGRARLWDATTGRPLGPPCKVEGTPALSSDDGSVMVTIAKDGPRVWDLSTGVERGTYHPFDDAFEVVARSHDGQRILASLPTGPDPHDSGIRRQGKRTRRYQLLDATSARPVGEPFTLDEGITGLALGPDGRILAVESLTQEGGSAPQAWSRLHDAASGKPLGQQLPGWTTGFSPDGQIVLVGSGAWNVPVSNANERLLPLGRSVRQVAFEPDGRMVVTVAGPADLCRWDLATGRVVYRLPDRAGRSVLSLSPDGRLALVAEGKVARLLRVETGREVGPPLNHLKPVTLASFSPDSKMVVTSEGTTFQVWDASTGRPAGIPRPCHGLVVTVAMGPAGAVYVEESPVPDADWGHRHIVWKDAASRRVGVPEMVLGGVATFSPDIRGSGLWVYKDSEVGLGGVATFNPDGRYLFVGGRHSGRLWDLSEDPPRARPKPVASEAAARGVSAVAFFGDGQIYAVAYEDGTTEVREIATDRRIGPTRKPDRKVPTAVVSELFRRLLGGPLSSFRAEATPTALSFSPDGHALLIGSDDGLTRLWSVPLTLPEHRVSRWLERRTAVELTPDLTLRALDRDQLLDRWSEFGDVR
jgi:WD40 repeat protein